MIPPHPAHVMGRALVSASRVGTVAMRPEMNCVASRGGGASLFPRACVPIMYRATPGPVAANGQGFEKCRAVMRRVAVAASFPAHPAPSAAACHRLVCSASSSEAATAEQQRRREEEGEEQGARAMTATRRDVHTLECSNLPYNVTPAEVATLFAEAGGDAAVRVKILGDRVGVARVQFRSRRAARQSQAELHASFYNGSRLAVDVAQDNALAPPSQREQNKQAEEMNLARKEADRRASLVKVRTSARSLSDIKRGLSERRLFREGSGRARGGKEWVPKWKKEDVRPGDWECPECGFRVFARTSQCFKCGGIKPGAIVASVRSSRRARVFKKEAAEIKEQSDFDQRQNLAGLLSNKSGAGNAGSSPLSLSDGTFDFTPPEAPQPPPPDFAQQATSKPRPKVPAPAFKGSYYEILGVEPLAEPSAIKASFRALAKELHPDVNPSPEALQRFIECTTAYEVLSDVDLRKKYDVRFKIENSVPLNYADHQDTSYQWAIMRATEAAEIAQRARAAAQAAGKESRGAKEKRMEEHANIKATQGGRVAKEVSRANRSTVRELRRRATQVRAWAQWAEKEAEIAQKDVDAWVQALKDAKKHSTWEGKQDESV
mmetsp:Transcript_41786/g.78183  ORF Transcript_41786/g.78183 Transcript_41786/m.78183 type:complete len:605 (-) Transcript_41786:159-1973(-)